MADKKEEQKIVYVQNVKPKGSMGVLWTWILLFWPVAIIYFFMRSWGKKSGD